MHETVGDKIFMAINYFLLGIILIVVAYPLIYMVSCSFSSSRAIASGRVFLWPVEPTLIGYKTIFQNKNVMLGYWNSAVYTILGTILSVSLTLLAAYPLSRKDFASGNFIMFIFTFTMFFGGGLIPSYLLMDSLGLTNTRAVMVLPGAVSAYNVIITRTFFRTNIPDELLDAAQIDGCSDFKFFLSIAIPLSKAIIAVIALFYAVGIWNSYFNALIYLNDRKLYPLQMFLREILVQNKVDADMLSKAYMNVEDIMARQQVYELLKYSLIVVASLPMLCIYPFIQQYFVKGVMIGSLKG